MSLFIKVLLAVIFSVVVWKLGLLARGAFGGIDGCAGIESAKQAAEVQPFDRYVLFEYNCVWKKNDKRDFILECVQERK